MRTIAKMLLVLCVLTTPAAALARDDMCGTIEVLIELAYRDFEQIDDGVGHDSNRTSFVLPGADSCDIVQSDAHSTYWCRWPSTRQVGAVQTRAFIDLIRACLGSDPDWVHDGNRVTAFIEERGVEFYVNGSEDNGPFEIELMVEFVGDRLDPPDLRGFV